MASRRVLSVVTLLLPAATVAAVLADGPRTTTQTCTTVLESKVCAWVTMEGGNPVEVGATVPMSLIESVPAEAPMVWPPEELADIALPAEARALGIDHLGINWEAHGHPPATFMTPHFDFHFYNVSAASVGAIDCSDLSKPSSLPAGYALPDIAIPDMGTLVGLCVPRMGMHAMPAADTEAADAFGASMILGYYGGSPIFFEPMVSQKLLLSGKDFTLPVPAVKGLPAGVRYPRALHATYDSKNREYRLGASGFGSR